MIEFSRNNNSNFLMVPVGDVIDIKPTMDISKNPLIKYMNNEDGICAFASFSSTLHYLKKISLGVLIFNLSKNYHTNFSNKHLNTIQAINNYIRYNEDFKLFRKIYKFTKIDKKCNIFDIKMKNNEILFISLRQSDNHQSHAVCICNEFIFDSNTTNALPFNDDGLDCCCGESNSFVGISYGYHIKLR